LAEFAYNSRQHSSIGMSPFMADLGYNPKSISDLVMGSKSGNRAAMSFAEHQQAILKQCRDILERTQADMKHYFDQNRPSITFKIGDQVLLDTLNLHLSHVGTTGARKTAVRFIGPYDILKIVSPDTYQLSLPPGLKLHDEFHVSYLKPYYLDQNSKRRNTTPKLITCDGSIGSQVKEIRGRRIKKGIVEYLVVWYGNDEASSWEPEANLSQVSGLIKKFLDSHNSAIISNSKEVSAIQTSSIPIPAPKISKTLLPQSKLRRSNRLSKSFRQSDLLIAQRTRLATQK
jgi:hypothetical protein